MKQPSKSAQKELISIDTNGKDVVQIPRTNKSYLIGWMKPYTTNKISKAFLENEAPENMEGEAETIAFMATKVKLLSKIAAYIILNDFWAIKFFHCIFWRWLFYIKQYDYAQLQPIIIEGKKKMEVESYYLNMLLAARMTDTLRTMTKTPQKEYLAEHTSV